jgi:hypothetical protein
VDGIKISDQPVLLVHSDSSSIRVHYLVIVIMLTPARLRAVRAASKVFTPQLSGLRSSRPVGPANLQAIGGRRWNSTVVEEGETIAPFVDSRTLKTYHGESYQIITVFFTVADSIGPRSKISHQIKDLSSSKEGNPVVLAGWLVSQR